jgi:hypothetical protein
MKYLSYIIFILFAPYVAFASFDITEIMYDVPGTDSGREWIEVKNISDKDLDLSTWYFLEANTAHKLVPVGSISIVPAGSYAIISDVPDKFMQDWSSFSGILFDSVFSLNNEGETIAMLSDNKKPFSDISSSVTYSSASGASGDGNSLQKIDGVWVSALPTPGRENVAYENIAPTGSSAPFAVVNPVKSSTSSVSFYSSKITHPGTLLSGISFKLENKIIAPEGHAPYTGRLVWNFGDGKSISVTNLSEPIYYSYQYPGDYLVTSSYYKNSYSTVPDVVSRLSLRVIYPEIIFSEVDIKNGDFVSLENKTSTEIDLSMWTIRGPHNFFVFPSGTIIMPYKKIKLSKNITGLSALDFSNLFLFNPSNNIIDSYPRPTSVANLNSRVSPKSSSTDQVYSSADRVVALSASSVSDVRREGDVIDLATIVDDSVNSPTYNFLPILGLIILIIFSIALVYIIRMRDREKEDSIHINPRDIDIVE